MAAKKSTTQDFIKTAKVKVDYVHDSLLDLKTRVTGELTVTEIEEIAKKLVEYRAIIVDTMSQTEKLEEKGIQGLPDRDKATISLNLIADINELLYSRHSFRSVSVDHWYIQVSPE